jgi:hypothetical protein
MGTGSFPGVKYGRGVLLTTHPLLVPRSWRSRPIPLPNLWATTGHVTGHCTFNFHTAAKGLKAVKKIPVIEMGKIWFIHVYL